MMNDEVEPSRYAFEKIIVDCRTFVVQFDALGTTTDGATGQTGA